MTQEMQQQAQELLQKYGNTKVYKRHYQTLYTWTSKDLSESAKFETSNAFHLCIYTSPFTLIPRYFCSDPSNINEGQVWISSTFGPSEILTMDLVVVSYWRKDHEKPAVVTQELTPTKWLPYAGFTQRGETLSVTQSVIFLNTSYLYKCFTWS